MNRDDVIRMAREAGLEKYHLPDSMMEYEFDRCIERFAQAAYDAGAAAEREAICKLGEDSRYSHQYVHSFLNAIRARGQA